MPRAYTADELESVRMQEAADAVAAAERARTAQQPAEGQIKLYHPTRDALKFGTGSMTQNGDQTTDQMIVFGHLEPGVAIVRVGHPLLPALLRRHPGIVVMEPGEVLGKSYLCDDCDQEFTTRRSLRAHRTTDHRPRARTTVSRGAAPAPVAEDDQALADEA
jgi:hypothetical protein